MTLYFCYEKAMTGRWEPVVYHGEAPRPSLNGKEAAPERTTVQVVPKSCIKPDGEPNFSMLTRHFPKPESTL